MYDVNTVYILGISKVGKEDPISSMFSNFFIGIIVDKRTNRIVDVTCNMVKDMTTDFISTLIRGYQLIEDIEIMEEQIKNRFHGMAQKSVIAALKDARNRYQLILEKQ